MIREEEIIKAARTAEKETAFKPIVMQGKGVNSAFGIGFLEGAEWADKTMIDKACEWLQNHNDYLRVHDNGRGVRFDITQCVIDFRKAMEE